MKTITTILILLLASQALAQSGPSKVIEVLFDETRQIETVAKEGTFIPNIQGYACPVPAIDIPSYQVWDVKLKHNEVYNFGVTGIGLRLVDPNMEFCREGWPTPESVFGMPMNEGDKINLKIQVRREIVEYENHNGTEPTTYLRETVTTELGSRALISEAHVRLQPTKR